MALHMLPLVEHSTIPGIVCNVYLVSTTAIAAVR